MVRDAFAGELPALSKQSLIRNVIEYGRAVHAELAAIVDAARQGVSIAECNMYVTAFPCHLCARYIVAAGIHRVLYIEPYPKSLAVELYPDSIRVESVSIGDNQVSFEPFVGVAPWQYMYLFDASARKDRDGNGILFDSSKAQMRYRSSERIYLEEEDWALRKLSSILDRQGTLFGGEHA